MLGTDAPPSQLDLAGLCGLLPAQVVPVLDELERRGLVARQRSEQDRRRSVVRLTPAGEETLAKADELARSIEDSLFGDCPPTRAPPQRDPPRRADAVRRGLRGEVIFCRVEDIEAWRTEIKRVARADKIKLRTGANDRIVWAVLVRAAA